MLIAITLFTWVFQILMDIGGHLWTKSRYIKHLLYLIGCRNAKSLAAKRTKGCPELRFYVRGSFYFKANSFLLFMKNYILDYTITVLLAAT